MVSVVAVGPKMVPKVMPMDGYMPSVLVIVYMV